VDAEGIGIIHGFQVLRTELAKEDESGCTVKRRERKVHPGSMGRQYATAAIYDPHEIAHHILELESITWRKGSL
jgi:hypothetical protein